MNLNKKIKFEIAVPVELRCVKEKDHFSTNMILDMFYKKFNLYGCLRTGIVIDKYYSYYNNDIVFTLEMPVRNLLFKEFKLKKEIKQENILLKKFK